MRTPTEYDVTKLMHKVYDPVKAHEYYERTKKLKGRESRGANEVGDAFLRRNGRNLPQRSVRGQRADPRRGKTRKQIAKDARAKQRKELSEAIDKLEGKLKKLEALIKDKVREEKAEDRESKAKKERAAKEKEKPKSAAEKAEIARENEKYRDKHKQELKNKAKKDGESSSKDKDKSAEKASVSELKSLATKVRGKIEVAKQKLAAL